MHAVEYIGNTGIDHVEEQIGAVFHLAHCAFGASQPRALSGMNEFAPHDHKQAVVLTRQDRVGRAIAHGMGKARGVGVDLE